MRISAGTLANGAAWGVFAVVMAVAVVLADVLGFLGLFLVGGATWLMCVRASLSHDTATWGPEAFAARMAGRSPEEREAMRAAREAELVPLRFFGRCGMVLAAIGTIGFIVQYWLAMPSNGH